MIISDEVGPLLPSSLIINYLVMQLNYLLLKSCRKDYYMSCKLANSVTPTVIKYRIKRLLIWIQVCIQINYKEYHYGQVIIQIIVFLAIFDIFTRFIKFLYCKIIDYFSFTFLDKRMEFQRRRMNHRLLIEHDVKHIRSLNFLFCISDYYTSKVLIFPSLASIETIDLLTQIFILQQRVFAHLLDDKDVFSYLQYI